MPPSPATAPEWSLAGRLTLALGIVFTLLGIWMGEPARIFEKATMVCLQCIGIG